MLLTRVTHEINEVVVTGRPPIIIGEINAKKSRFLTLSSEHIASAFFENTTGKELGLKSFLFKINEVKYKTAVRIRMLSRHDYVQDIYVENETISYPSFIPADDLVRENIIVYIEPGQKGIIEVELSEYNIELPKEGAFMAIECLGYYDNGRIVDSVDKPTKLEMHVSATDNYCLRLNFKDMWININKWMKGDFKYAIKEEPPRKIFVAPTFGLKVFNYN